MFALLLLFLLVHSTAATVLEVELFKAPSIQVQNTKEALEIESGEEPTSSSPVAYENTPYVTKVSLGTSPQNFDLAVHTGSTTLWVFDESVDPKNGYKTNSSSTKTLLQVPEFFESIGDTIFKGKTYTDLFQIESLTYNNQSFGVIDTVEKGEEALLADGIFGLGWVFDPKDRHKDEMPILNLISQMEKPLYTVWLKKFTNIELITKLGAASV